MYGLIILAFLIQVKVYIFLKQGKSCRTSLRNKDDNIYKSKDLKRQDKRTLTRIDRMSELKKQI